MRFFRPMGIGLLLLAAQVCASAADLAVLKSGSTIPFLRKEEIGTVTRLYIPGGHMDIPTSQIASYDKDDSPLDDLSSGAQPAASNPAMTNAPTAPASSAPAKVQQASAAAQAPAIAPSRDDIDQLVRQAASKHQLDPDFVASVIKAESDFNPHAVSPKGARGLMQLMPQTATQLGVKDAFDPQANVEAGTAHLSDLLDQYHNDPIKALAAYNAGAHRVKQYHGIPPYRETQAYVAKIVRDFNAKKRAEMKAAAGTKNTRTASRGSNAQSAKSSRKPAKSQSAQSGANQSAPGSLMAAN